jgi:transposase-like protein
MEIMPDKSAASAKAFLENLIAAFPAQIEKILTDNGKEFTGRYCRSGMRDPTGRHPFDRACAAHAIEHRLIKPRHPRQTAWSNASTGALPKS